MARFCLRRFPRPHFLGGGQSADTLVCFASFFPRACVRAVRGADSTCSNRNHLQP